MAVIKPFRGLRYNLEKIDNLAEVIAPAYDPTGSDDRKEYYNKHKYNTVYLEHRENAALTLNSWLKQKILEEEDKPALYRYQQEFLFNGEKKVRSGIICTVKIEPYEKGIILPHEETLDKYREDSLELLKSSRVTISPILGLYNDAGSTVDSIMEKAAEKTPDIDFTDESGTVHRVWVIKDGEIISQVQESMKRMRIFLASGHHLYEAALNYRNYRREAQGITSETDDNPFDYVMMTLVNLYSPNLVILPCHRLVKNVKNFNLDKMLNILKEDFKVEDFAVDPGGSNLEEFLNLVSNRGGFDQGLGIDHRRAFGLYAGKGQGYVITLESETALDRLMPREKSLAWQGLDVSVLHTTIIDRLLTTVEKDQTIKPDIHYTRKKKEVLKMVDSGEYQTAFFMNPPLLDEVTAVAIGGEKMPPKSTYFYPGLPAGLIINKL
ncbi:MAG: DUF1015 domain-containing protein [Desulfotomaculum sp.]|nr:DUF1015 domain-containing protein [Desulfotomaculum sp.]